MYILHILLFAATLQLIKVNQVMSIHVKKSEAISRFIDNHHL
jgi:hypothetical protein